MVIAAVKRGNRVFRRVSRWWISAFRIQPPQVICPSGAVRDVMFGCFVQPFSKNISVFPKCKSGVYFAPSRPTRGRLAIVTNAGRDAMDAGGASDEGAKPADGEVAWS